MTLSASDFADALREGYAQESGYSLEEYGDHDFSDDEMWSEYHWGSSTPFVVPGIDGTVRVIESEGGGEGSGEHMHVVFEVEFVDAPTQWFKVDGFYASWDGASWEGSDAYVVKPVERTVTFFER